MTKYWFYLEPYVFLWQKKQKILLYNTFSGEGIQFHNTGILKELILKLLNPENMYCVSLTSYDLKNSDIKSFVNKVIESFNGDLQDCSNFKEKPIVMYPKLNFQEDIKRLQDNKDLSIGKKILNHLSEISFHITENCTHNCTNCDTYYKQVPFCTNSVNKISVDSLASFLSQIKGGNVSKINLIGNDLIKCDNYISLLRTNEINPRINISFHINYLNLDTSLNELSLLEENNIKLKILVNFPIDNNQLEKIIKNTKGSKGNYAWLFAITSEEDYFFVESITNEYKLLNIEIKPVFTGKNLNFFRDNIYLNKEDILSRKQDKQKIFAKQVLNTFDYGKLTVMSDGKVYANINNPALGTIDMPIKELLYKEITEGVSWHRIRGEKECIDCVYQWLCPSPSNYEIAIGNENLCHLNS